MKGHRKQSHEQTTVTVMQLGIRASTELIQLPYFLDLKPHL